MTNKLTLIQQGNRRTCHLRSHHVFKERPMLLRSLGLLGLAALLLGACGSDTPPSAKITQFQLPVGGNHPRELVAGPDGNIWFTEYVANRIGRITPDGKVTEFPIVLPEDESFKAAHQPFAIVAGKDGNLWFTEGLGNAVARITPS